MSRSRRKNPFRGITTSESEKADKVAGHRKVRRAVKRAVQAKPDGLLPHERELTSPWSMAKDGKFRFDPRAYPRGMRK